MFGIESKRRRVFVVAVSRGEPLVGSLLRFAREKEITSASFTGAGVLQEVSLDLPSVSGRKTFRLEGPLELVALTGTIGSSDQELAVDARVHLARATDAGLSSHGGRLVEAKVEEVELLVTALDDLGLRRDVDEELGVSRLRNPRPTEDDHEEITAGDVYDAPTVPFTLPKSSSSWAAAAAASEAVEDVRLSRASAQAKSASGAWVPNRGEFIDHKVFGICRVEAVKPDGTMIIKLETGRRKQLKLDALEVLEPKTGGARVIYPVRMKRGG